MLSPAHEAGPTSESWNSDVRTAEITGQNRKATNSTKNGAVKSKALRPVRGSRLRRSCARGSERAMRSSAATAIRSASGSS